MGKPLQFLRERIDDLSEHGVRVTRVRCDSDDLPFIGYMYEIDLFLLFDLNDFTINIVYSQEQLLDALLDNKRFKYIRNGLALDEDEYNVFKSHFNQKC